MGSPESRHNDASIEFIVRALVFRDDTVLVCRSNAGGYCYLPGGHVEFGESARAALAREFHEETGLDIKPGDCILVHEHVFRQKSRLHHEVNLLFRVELDDAATVRSREAKIEFAWLPIERLPVENFLPVEIAAVVPSLMRTKGGPVFMSTVV